MKIDWRVSAIAASSAFVLSFVIGLIGNVAFGSVVLRALLSAVFFGGGAVGLLLVVDRFLPELRRSSGESAPANDGASIDIVVDESLEPAPGSVESEAVVTQTPVAENEYEMDEQSITGDSQQGEFAEDEAEVLEEVSESDEEIGGLEPAEPEEESGSPDELPSVESMSDSFSEVPLGDEAIDDSSGSGEDPALMARAIRSVLKREE